MVTTTTVYAARVKDRELLKNSSSGGAFTALSDVFLEHGDAVVCAIYNYENKQTEFKLITSKEERDSARGSKYMQSTPGNIYKDAVVWMKKNQGKKILFVGMGCQTAGFQKFIEMSGLRERVTLVDIICHGSPSPMIWRDYAKSLEIKDSGKMDYLTFKDKRNGWSNPTAVATINGREESLKEYVRIFYNQCALRPSCHKCPYTTVERSTDITIGDYWGIDKVMPDFFDPSGNSLLLIHTQKGQELFNNCKEALDYKESNTTDCLQPNLVHPTTAAKDRTKFWQDYYANGIHYIVKKYGAVSLKLRTKNKIKKILGKV